RRQDVEGAVVGVEDRAAGRAERDRAVERGYLTEQDVASGYHGQVAQTRTEGIYEEINAAADEQVVAHRAAQAPGSRQLDLDGVVALAEGTDIQNERVGNDVRLGHAGDVVGVDDRVAVEVNVAAREDRG